jgi:ribosomal protein S18 acetylase RimI-like enzyme
VLEEGLMNTTALRARTARPQDAQVWLRLSCLAQDKPLPDDTADQTKLFLSSPPDVADNRFLCWLGAEPVACWTVHQLENIMEIRDFFVVKDYLAAHGSGVLEQMIASARERCTVLTVDSYPETYSHLFLNAGFDQRARTRMMRSLETYQICLTSIPTGLSLRHPRLGDEEAAAALTYRNYQGTVDEGMVCSNKAQASAMIHGIFGQQYCRFDMDSSFLIEDEQQRLIGTIFLGDMSSHEMQRLMWVLDVSVSPEWRGKGLGKALMINGLNAARTKRYAHIGLVVTLGNQRAIALYRSLGFQQYGDLLYEAVKRFPGEDV